MSRLANKVETLSVEKHAHPPTCHPLYFYYCTYTAGFVICITASIQTYLNRDYTSPHYFPFREVSSRDLAWEIHGHLAAGIIPLLPPNVTWADQQTNPISGPTNSIRFSVQVTARPTASGIFFAHVAPSSMHPLKLYISLYPCLVVLIKGWDILEFEIWECSKAALDLTIPFTQCLHCIIWK